MTAYQWAMIGLTALGFLVTLGGVVGGCVWAVAKIKTDVSDKIEVERKLTAESFVKMAKDLEDDQKTQDRNFGEMGAALRRFIETVEKEMHAIEIWGRDHYALKEDVEKSIDVIRTDIKALGADIKIDMRELAKKIDAQH